MKAAARVALVTNVLPHYRVPCFEALATRLHTRNIAIDFFVLTAHMAQRQFVLATEHPQLNVQVLPGITWSRAPRDDVHLNSPLPVLRGYDLVILSGWDEPTFLLLWFLTRLRGKRVAFWVESTLQDNPRTTWKETYKRYLLRHSAGAIVMGTRSAAYCEWLGVPRAKILIAPNAADSPYYRAQAAALLPQRAALREALDFQGVVILFVGRMVDFFKRVSTLLRAAQILQAQGVTAQFVLVGEGPDRALYEAQCAAWGLTNVRLKNFMDHAALARYYAAADVFVLPSRSETWGLVLNEAMEFGLPVVTTQAVGAAPDLVGEGENGYVVPPEDAAALAGALGKLVCDAELRRRMGERSRARIQAFTPDAWADGFTHAIETMLE